ncbi:hypothetical protein ASG17_10635 [Brevundimonas sp. Leaf363]|uniref:hypothetical protein n=1 Tax=Brevundimonas sp. Leaf363 TaxID=1736353 RepID=UPI0006FE5F24|nr:hypothetical protein [Brevundimonas sp. Leaf363]KQS56437.1 hypothetical protein ASG17_10635 [Brevundimonas sp. Leaf363]
MSLSATEAAFEGFRVARRSPLAIVWWSGAYLLMFAAVFLIGGPALVQVMAQAQALESGGDPSMDDIRALGESYAAFMGWIVPPAIIIGAMLNAAVARAVIRPAESAFGYLRLGMDEVRVFVVSLALGVLVAVAAMVIFGVIGVLAGFASASGQSWMWLIIVLASLAGIAAIVWLMVRLSLAIPITLAERRMAVLSSWGLTKGHFWPLFGIAVIAAIMSIIVSLLGGIVAAPLTLLTGGLNTLSSQEGATLVELIQVGWPALLAWGVINSVLSALQIAVLYAPFSAAYLQLRGAAPTE